MKKELLSFAVLMFLAVGICFAVLYNIGVRTIEENIVQDNALRAAHNDELEKEAAASANIASNGNQQKEIKKANGIITESKRIVKNKVPILQKILMANLLLSKLSSSDISELKGMLVNGITAEENKRAKEILYSRLSNDDINRIRDAYAKYTKQ